MVAILMEKARKVVVDGARIELATSALRTQRTAWISACKHWLNSLAYSGCERGVIVPQRLVFVKCGACQRTMDQYHERLPLFRPSPIAVRVSRTNCRRCQ